MEDTLDLVDADSQRIQREQDIGTGIDQIDLALKHDDGGHAGPVDVPAVALAAMDHREIFPAQLIETQGIRRFIALERRQVEIDHRGLPLVGELEHVEQHAPDENAVADLHRVDIHRQGVQQLSRVTDLAEREFQLHPHQFVGADGIDPGLDDLLFRHQAVIAAIDVLHLRLNLIGTADQQRLDPGIAGMTGQDHALTVEHLEDGKLGQIGKIAVLDHGVRQQDGVGTGLERNAVAFDRDDQATLHQMLDRIGRTTAQNG